MSQLEEMKSCGLVICEDTILVKYWVSQATSMVGQNVGNIDRVLEEDMESKVLKIALMSETIKNNPDGLNQDWGCAKSLAESFGVSRKWAKKIIREMTSQKSPTVIATWSKKKTVVDTIWHGLVQEFCLAKPVCREVPGEGVSIAYGKWTEKFIRQFSIKDIFKLFKLKYPDFEYELCTFYKVVLKNLVKPSLQDVKQNTCPLHENVKWGIKAFNRFVNKNKAKDLRVPSSTLDICLQFICSPDE